MLNICYAPPGGGKTRYVSGRISAVSQEESVLLIVPEQQHFETERRLFRTLGSRRISGVNITSFTKLSGDIINAYGEPKPYADDTVKTITMMTALQSAGEPPAKARETLRLYARFMREGVTAAMIRSAVTKNSADIKSGSRRLYQKLSSVEAVFSAYESLLSPRFADKLRDLPDAVALAVNSGFFAGKSVFFDGFDGFTGAQMLMISAMLSADANVTITLSMPFAYTEQVADRLERLAKAQNRSCVRTNVAGGGVRSPEIADIRTAPDVYAEANYVASVIHELTFGEDSRFSFSDIAVVCEDTNMLPVLASAFGAYDISCFLDIPVSLGQKPVVRFIITALEATTLDTDAFLRFIKSGFVRVKLPDSDESRLLSRRDISRFEEAIRSYGMRSGDLRKSFARYKDRHLDSLEPVREAIVTALEIFRQKLSSADGAGKTKALAEFLLTDMRLENSVSSIINNRGWRFAKGFSIDQEKAAEYRQLWEMIITIFESLYAALSEREVSVADYTALLTQIFTETNMAKSPRVIDAVSVGDAHRSRYEPVKIAFVVGATSDYFGAHSADSGSVTVFSPAEIDELERIGLPLQDSFDVLNSYEAFVLERTLVLPAERLYLSASYRDASYRAVLPAKFLFQQGAAVHDTRELPPAFFVRTPASLRLQRALQGGQSFADNYAVSSADALRLAKRDRLSPSALEKLCGCMYGYFLSYGLDINEREELPDDARYTLPPGVRGDMLHYVLKRIFSGNYNERDITESGIADEISRFCENNPAFGFADNPRRTAAALSYAPELTRLARNMREDLSATGFSVAALERQLSFFLGDMEISGIADRVDVSADGRVRVVDYKSGGASAEMKLPEIYYGLSIQPLLYLFAACESMEKPPHSANYQFCGAAALGKADYHDGFTPDLTKAKKDWEKAHKLSGVDFSESAEAFEPLKTYLRGVISARRAKLYAGEIAPVPIESACAYCAYKAFCGSRTKIEIDKSRTELPGL